MMSTNQNGSAAPNKPSDIHVAGVTLYFLPVKTRVPLKFGHEVLDSVTCARVQVKVESRDGRTAEGWGETPLSVPWVWPSSLTYEVRHNALKEFTTQLTTAVAKPDRQGHPIEIGDDFQRNELPQLLEAFNAQSTCGEPMPWLAALVCCSAFDIAIHDAFANLVGKPVYDTYGEEYLTADLAELLEPDEEGVSFAGLRPDHFLLDAAPSALPAWHLVGGLDLLTDAERTGDEPDDGYPVVLEEWIDRDGLDCLKIKLRGNDSAWDYDRIVTIGHIGLKRGVQWLTTDFNCTVSEPAYVNEILDKLQADEPKIYEMILYVEQPFPYDLESSPIDVHSITTRKPLFLDESAHDWRHIRLGRRLGWDGVALKTCKTQTGAILSLCWAKAHGMALMVQDLTNPMLAQLPHVQLAAHAGTIMGVETNGMQFYPEASNEEAKVHPGLYQRRNGQVDLSTIQGTGFGYQVEAIGRSLPAPACTA